MVGVVTVGAEVVTQRELVAAAWLVFIVVPGVREPVYLAHGGKSHGLFHGKVIVAVEARVAGVGAGYLGISVQIRVYMRVSLRSPKAVAYGSQLAFQMKGVVV